MKKIFTFGSVFLFILCSTVLAISCSKENDDVEPNTNDGTEVNENMTNTDSIINGYWYADNTFIYLTPLDSSIFYVQSRDLNEELSKEWVVESLSDCNVKSIQEWHGGFKICAGKRPICEKLYISRWYSCRPTEGIVVLPNIKIRFNNDHLPHDFSERYGPFLNLKGSELGEYYFYCNLPTSDDVLLLLAKLNKEPDVVLCEPVMQTDIDGYEQDGIIGKWSLDSIRMMRGTMTFQIGEILCSFVNENNIAIKNVYTKSRPFFKGTGTYDYSINAERHLIDIDGKTYQYNLKDNVLSLDEGSAWDANIYYFQRIK